MQRGLVFWVVFTALLGVGAALNYWLVIPFFMAFLALIGLVFMAGVHRSRRRKAARDTA